MDQGGADIMARLGAAIEAWQARITETHGRLMEQLAEARGPTEGPTEDDEAAEPGGDLAAAVAALEDALAERNARIAALAAEATMLKEQADAAETALREAREETQRLRDQNAALRTALESNLRKGAPADALTIQAFDARGHKKRMGEILVELGIITPEQLRGLLTEQHAAPQRRLGRLVVDRGYTNEVVIARILASQLRLPFTELREGDVSPGAPSLISAQLARLHHCVPIRKEGDCVILAMANPMDLIAIEDVEHATGCRVEPVVATSAAIEFVIARQWGKA